MKSSSLVKTSFSHFWSLFTGHWQLYGWYLLCRLVELLLLGLLTAGIVMSQMFGPDSGFLVLGVMGAIFLGAFLLETWFVFSLYRSLDEAGKDHSLGGFLGRGRRDYWPTLGKYVLLGVLWFVVVFGGSALAALTEGSGLEPVIGFAFIAVLLYVGLPFMLAMYEVIITSSWPWSTFLMMRKKLKGFWWRMFGTLILWGLVALVVYMVIGFVFGSLLFANVMSVARDLQASSTMDPLQAMEQISQLFTGGFLFSVLGALLVFIAASIVPVYGFFSVYKGVKKLSK